MIEQMNLFGEVDPFDELCRNIVKAYEKRKERTGSKLNFDEWLLDCFHSYWGGNSTMYVTGYRFFEFTPNGMKVKDPDTLIETKDGTERKTLFFPKAKILKAFGVKDKKEMDE